MTDLGDSPGEGEAPGASGTLWPNRANSKGVCCRWAWDGERRGEEGGMAPDTSLLLSGSIRQAAYSFQMPLRLPFGKQVSLSSSLVF